MFDNMINPVQMGVDTKGRLWAAVWPNYPKWEPIKNGANKQMQDSLVILPDKDRDGVADKMITFARVHNPTGFEFWNGGVIVASCPDLIYLKDTDGDDKADVKERLLHGLDSADTHHAANNIVYGPGGYIYYQRGVFHVSNVETPWRGPQRHRLGDVSLQPAHVQVLAPRQQQPKSTWHQLRLLGLSFRNGRHRWPRMAGAPRRQREIQDAGTAEKNRSPGLLQRHSLK